MSRWKFRPAWGWFLLLIGLSAAIAGTLIAGGKRWGQTAQGAAAVEREESEALSRGRACLDRGQPPAAIRAVSLITEGSPRQAEALTIRGMALAALEEVGPARQTLERAWSIRPSADAARVLAAIYLSASENERGLQMLLEASRLDPSDHRPWFAMGELVYLPLRRYDLAVDAFRQSLQRHPDHVESRIGLIDALVRSYHLEEAKPLLDAVLPKRPDDPRLLVLSAELKLELGREDEAAGDLERTLALDPDRFEALVLHARILFRRGRRREALAEAERACARDPNNPAALSLLASIQASLGLKVESATTLALRETIEERAALMDKLKYEILKNPHDPEPRWRLGQLAAQAGLTPLAIQCYQAALAEAPNFEPAFLSLLKLGFPSSKLPRPSPITSGSPAKGVTGSPRPQSTGSME